MNTITWPYLIVLFGAVQGIMLSLALSFRKGIKNKANQVLIPFTLSVSLMLLIAVVFSTGMVSTSSKIGYLGDSIMLLYGPLFFFYTLRLLTTTEKRIWPHLIPFFGFFVLNSFILLFPINIYNTQWLGIFYWGSISASFIHMGVYFVLSFRAIQRYNKSAKDKLSFHAATNYLKLLTIIVGSCTLLFAINTYSNLLGIPLGWSFLTYQLQWVIFATVTFVLGYFAMRRPDIFKLESKPRKTIPTSENEHNLINNILGKLQHCLAVEKPYLNPDLTLDELALQIGYRKELLSKAINQGLSTNFYGLINQYRIDAFEQLAKDKANSHLTHSALAMEAGFRSKTTFYKAFKTLKATTPSNYLKNRVAN